MTKAEYAYDSFGRLQSVSDGTDDFDYAYETDSNLLASLEGPVHAVDYSYKSNRDLMTIVDNKASDLNGSSLSKYEYSYDVLGRRDDRAQTGSAINTTSADDFAYNARSEVIGSNNDTETAAEWNPTYAYDNIGNRLSSTGFQPVNSYTTNELNQYTKVEQASSLSEPTYDADGNLIDNGEGWTYTWNGENRLIQATDGTVTIDFTYDHQGRLVKKDDGNNVEVYVYDDWNRIATFKVENASLSLQTAYLWGMDLSGSMQGAGGVGGLLKEGDLYPTYDANGNIMQKLDDTGSVVMSVTYDPFGNIIDGTLVGEYAFSTKPLIDNLQYYYYGFRYYNAELGRWLNRDPIKERGGLNVYGFAGNNTLNNWDLLGNEFIDQRSDKLTFYDAIQGSAGLSFMDLNVDAECIKCKKNCCKIKENKIDVIIEEVAIAKGEFVGGRYVKYSQGFIEDTIDWELARVDSAKEWHDSVQNTLESSCLFRDKDTCDSTLNKRIDLLIHSWITEGSGGDKPLS